MKKILRAVLNWLDRKFPDKVVVTQKDYDAMLGRVKNLEMQVQGLNVSLGLGSKIAVGGMGPFQR